MGLRLQGVAPARGWAWVRQAFQQFFRKPGAFMGLFVFGLLGILVLMTIPVVGGLLGLAMLPMLTLGFMVAARSAVNGGPVLPSQLVAGLHGPDRARARAQWLLCALYALVSVAVIEITDFVDGGAWERLQLGLSRQAKPEQMALLLADPLLLPGWVVRFGAAALVSVPFWFAPALVFWAGQSAGQALFSSTLAVWRAKGAFVSFSLAWVAICGAILSLMLLLWLLVGQRQLVVILVMPAMLVMSAAFYVSLWFGYADCFGDEADAPPEA